MQNLVMVQRSGRPEHTPEAEPVVIDTDTPDVVRLELDDGECIDFNRVELLAALQDAA